MWQKVQLSEVEKLINDYISENVVCPVMFRQRDFFTTRLISDYVAGWFVKIERKSEYTKVFPEFVDGGIYVRDDGISVPKFFVNCNDDFAYICNDEWSGDFMRNLIKNELNLDIIEVDMEDRPMYIHSSGKIAVKMIKGIYALYSPDEFFAKDAFVEKYGCRNIVEWLVGASMATIEKSIQTIEVTSIVKGLTSISHILRKPIWQEEDGYDKLKMRLLKLLIQVSYFRTKKRKKTLCDIEGLFDGHEFQSMKFEKCCWKLKMERSHDRFLLNAEERHRRFRQGLNAPFRKTKTKYQKHRDEMLKQIKARRDERKKILQPCVGNESGTTSILQGARQRDRQGKSL